MQYLEDVVNIQSILTMVSFLTIKSQPCVQEVAQQLQSATLYSNRVTLENKRIHTPPLFPPFKVGVFVVFYR